MRTILRTRFALAAALALFLGLGGACSSEPTGDPGRFSVAVAENFWGSIVEQLGGPDAHVTSIIANPNADPHEYEPTVADAQTIATARYVIVNGIGYDAWAQKLLDVDTGGDRTVLNVGDLLGLDADSNPHQWYSPSAVRRFAARVSSDLIRLDPEHRGEYEQRRRAFASSGLREYNRLISEIKRRFSGVRIGASESIVEPWASGMELRLVTPESFLEAVAEGNEPTASDKATVDAQIEHHEINVFVYNSQNATPDVQRLVEAARDADIPVTTVTETLTPEGATFQAWQVRELQSLLDALNRSDPS